MKPSVRSALFHNHPFVITKTRRMTHIKYTSLQCIHALTEIARALAQQMLGNNRAEHEQHACAPGQIFSVSVNGEKLGDETLH